MLKIIEGSIESVPGFRAAGVRCGIKNEPNPDLGVIVCDTPCTAAAVFTTNRVQAAPVLYCKKVLAANADKVRAVVVNAGNANACTGEQGHSDAAVVADEAERLLGLESGSALVMSTGVIGVPLPVDKLYIGLGEVKDHLAKNVGKNFSRAIMTTDLVEKSLAVRFEIAGCKVTMGAAAKGSGMIHPNMATMLGFITTDAAVEQGVLQHALREAASRTFNMISVDGDQSPNDSVFLLASGSSGAPKIKSPDSPEYEAFYEALYLVCETLAKKIAADGEGATRLVEIRVKGSRKFEEAQRVARAVAGSPLVKTAIHGADPNWGRIICAAGSSGIPVEPDKIDIYFGRLLAVKGGLAAETARDKLAGELN
ncbi:MAG: bifunctional glutamate N-acetyltransferase/amino-acid acetyltransferase ArgJ, partial [Gemmatimonadota bacterium]|nr:bifunctional glutamate N-acetyltransferase/amino-acid acetyltransferase ArgJ [Gemmatimonadota bacterium]